MIKVFIYTNNDVNIDSKQIEYIFANSKLIEISFLKNISELVENSYIITFNKFYNPKKKFDEDIKKIIDNNVEFCYLSKDKEIFISNKITVDNNKVTIKRQNKFNTIFFPITNKYEHIIVPSNLNDEYILLIKSYYKSYSSIFNGLYSYDSYKTLYNDIIHNAYLIVVIINDIKDLAIIDFSKLDYYNYRVNIVYKNLDCIETSILKNYCSVNNYISYPYKSYLINLKYLWFETLVFINNKSTIDFNRLNEMHKTYNIVRINNLISIKGDYAPYLDNLNIVSNSKTYPSSQNDHNILYTKIIEARLLGVKGYDKIYEEINSIPKKSPQQVTKIVSMAILCNKPVSFTHLPLNNCDHEILYSWFLLLCGSANKTQYEQLIKNISGILINTIIDKDLLKQNKQIGHIIIQVFNYLMAKFEPPVFRILLKATEYLSKSMTHDEINKVIILLLPFVSRSDCLIEFTELLKKIYPNFTYEKFLDIFPYEKKAIDLLIYITTNFTPDDNLALDVFTKRNQIKDNLTNLLNEPSMGVYDLDTILYLNTGNFYLSYHGVPSKEIFVLKAKLIRKICPSLEYSIDTNFTNPKKKICFISSFLNRSHSVFKDRHQVIKHLASNPLFEVYFITADDLTDDVKNEFGNAIHIKIERNLTKTKDLLTSMKLDVLVYCEIGMDFYFYILAFMRLAKVQMDTWGHSDTSGIDTVDYFISSKLYELPYTEAQTHYSEKLILQNSLCTSYVNPLLRHKSYVFKDRYHYGFNDASIIYFCAQSIFKFSNQYYDYIQQILKANPTAVMIMIISDKRHIFTNKIDSNVVNRIHWMPPAQHGEYLNMIKISDVVLDTYPFGGCNSCMEAFSLGKVVVTQPSVMINGRFTRGFYEKMGLSKYICNSKEKYINFAVKLADKKFRTKIEKEIIKASPVLFNDKETLKEWEDLMLNH